MRSPSPIVEGFGRMIREPLAGLAEVAWRWTAGGIGIALAGFFAAEYIKSLPVDSLDMMMLRSGNGWLISRGLAHILGGSAGRFRAGGKVVLLASTLAWIGLSAVGRAATIHTLTGRTEGNARGGWRLGPLLGLSLLRALATYAACVSGLGVVAAAMEFSSTDPQTIQAALSLVMAIGLFIFLAWYAVNWFLSLASIFVVRDGKTVLGAAGALADLCSCELGPMLAVSGAFGLAHFAIFVAASGLALVPLSLLSVAPAAVGLGLLGLMTLGYLAIADYLYIGRLAAYLAIAHPREASETSVSDAAKPPGPAEIVPSLVLPVPDFGQQT